MTDQAPTTPDSVVVPVEPTEAMIEAAAHAPFSDARKATTNFYDRRMQTVADMLRAGIAARPAATPGGEREALVDDLAKQLAASIAGLGYPVGLGTAPPEDACRKAANGIIDLYGDRLAAHSRPAPVAAHEINQDRAVGGKTEGVITRDGCWLNLNWIRFGAERSRRLYDPLLTPLSPALADLLVYAFEEGRPNHPSAPVAEESVGAAAILEMAAKAIEDHQKEGREWVKGSLWDDLTREAAARIRALKSALNATPTPEPAAARGGEELPSREDVARAMSPKGLLMTGNLARADKVLALFAATPALSAKGGS